MQSIALNINILTFTSIINGTIVCIKLIFFSHNNYLRTNFNRYMPSTLKDIAEKTGVSISTVSRVLHDKSKKYKISDETAAKVMLAAKDLGYRVNALARGLRQQKTREIGIIIPDISNPFFSDIVKCLASELRKKGYNFIVCTTQTKILQLKEQALRVF